MSVVSCSLECDFINQAPRSRIDLPTEREFSPHCRGRCGTSQALTLTIRSRGRTCRLVGFLCGGHSVQPKAGTWDSWKRTDRCALSGFITPRSPSHAVSILKSGSKLVRAEDWIAGLINMEEWASGGLWIHIMAYPPLHRTLPSRGEGEPIMGCVCWPCFDRPMAGQARPNSTAGMGGHQSFLIRRREDS